MARGHARGVRGGRRRARRHRPVRLPPGQHADPRLARRAPRARPGARRRRDRHARQHLGRERAARARRRPAARGGCAPGMRVLLAAAGSGFTWGAGVVEWGLRMSVDAPGRRAARWSPAARAGSARRSARALAADGWPVAVNYRSGAARRSGDRRRDRGRRRARRRARGRRQPTRRRRRALLEAAREALGGPVLALVNNAGVRADGLALSLTDEDWQRRARHQPRRDLPPDPRRAARDDPRALRPRRSTSPRSSARARTPARPTTRRRRPP